MNLKKAKHKIAIYKTLIILGKIQIIVTDDQNKTPVNQVFTGASFYLSVPRAGIEPARIAPLVFETSASTDSAIWAFARPFSGAKIVIFYVTTSSCVQILFFATY